MGNVASKAVHLRIPTESSYNPNSLTPNKYPMDSSDSTDISRKVIYLDIPAKSDNDKKEYRVIQLNGIKVLLISDQNVRPNKSETLPATSENNDDEVEDIEEEDDGEEEEDEDEDEEEDGEEREKQRERNRERER